MTFAVSWPAVARALCAVCLIALALRVVEGGDEPPAAKPEPGWVGLYAQPVQQLERAQAAEMGVRAERGTVVTVVVEGSPAEAAGVREGDFLVEIDAVPVPDFEVTGKDDAKRRSAWHAALRARLEALVPGKTVALVVARAGVRTTLSLVPASPAEARRIQGCTDAALPDLATAGEPVAASFDFDGLEAGAALPAGFWPYRGQWRLAAAPGAEKGLVLRQGRETLPWAVLLVAGPGRALRDGTVRVRLMPLTGIADQSGGILFRAQDPENYYVVRPNAIEDNFRLYVVKDGVRTTLADLKVTPPAAGAWHELEVSFVGDTFRATVDGKDAIEAKDSTFASGWCGLWTKADSVTLFDDLRITPAAPAAGGGAK